MSKKRPGQNQINLTNIFNSKKAKISTPYFTTKMDSISKMNSNLRKLYLPAISRKVIPKIQVSSIKLVKSHSQENFNISIDNNQLEHNKQNCQYNEKEKLLFLKLTLSRIEAKINDLMINYKKLLNEKNQNLKAIKEIINSNNSSEKEILLNKIQYLLENSWTESSQGIQLLFAEMLTPFLPSGIIFNPDQWFNYVVHSGKYHGYAFSLVGTGYIIGGRIGVVLLFFIVGLMCRHLYKNSIKDVYNMVSYICMISAFIASFRSSAGSIYTSYVRTILIPIIFCKFIIPDIRFISGKLL